MGPDELHRVLQDLTDDELKTFLFHLTMSDATDDNQPINEPRLLRANLRATVDLMVKAYTLEGALKVTRRILEKMNRNDLVQKLPAAVDSSPEVQIIDEAPAATPSSSLWSPRREAPSLEEQILTSVAECTERWGLSEPELRQVLAAKGVDVDKSNEDISRMTSRLVHEGTLTETDGNGTLFYKLNKEAVKKATAAANTAGRKASAAEKVAAMKKSAAEEATEKAAEAEEEAAMKRAEATKAAEAAASAIAVKEAADKKADVVKRAAATKRAAAAHEKAETAIKRAAVATQKAESAGRQQFSSPFKP